MPIHVSKAPDLFLQKKKHYIPNNGVGTPSLGFTVSKGSDVIGQVELVYDWMGIKMSHALQ